MRLSPPNLLLPTLFKLPLLILITLLIFTSFTHAQKNQDKDVFMFCYFKGNGEDGLHLAYSLDGFKWQALKKDSSLLTPLVGKDKLMRDPCIIRGADGKFHMVWTVSWREKGIGYASSADLVHWSAQQYIPVMEHEKNAQNAWAPEITYDSGKKQYIIYWATTIPGRFPKTDSTGDNNHRIYYVTTKDFKTFSKASLLYNQGFNVIDASIQPVNKKKYVMFLKDETRNPPQKNIRMAFSKKGLKKFGNPSAPITGNYWAEGPTAIQLNGKWIVYFDKYRNHEYGAVTSTDLVHWTDISDSIEMPKGIRHGTVFTVSQNELLSLRVATGDVTKAEQAKMVLEASTIDQLAIGEQQSETEHNFKGENTESGTTNNRRWRSAKGWFSYDLKNTNNEGRKIRVTYFGLDRDRVFDIYINNTLLRRVELNGMAGANLFNVDYALPENFVKNDSEKVYTVKFIAQNGSVAGRIFHLRLLK